MAVRSDRPLTGDRNEGLARIVIARGYNHARDRENDFSYIECESQRQHAKFLVWNRLDSGTKVVHMALMWRKTS